MKEDSAILDLPPPMAKRPTPPPEPEEERDRIDLRAEPEWVARVKTQAKRFGIKVSAYIRQAVSERLEQDEASQRRLRQGDH